MLHWFANFIFFFFFKCILICSNFVHALLIDYAWTGDREAQKFRQRRNLVDYYAVRRGTIWKKLEWWFYDLFENYEAIEAALYAHSILTFGSERLVHSPSIFNVNFIHVQNTSGIKKLRVHKRTTYYQKQLFAH